jgi:hypothetical protein
MLLTQIASDLGQSGVALMLCSGPIFARSIKQKIVTKSSAEAELVALADEVTNGIWANRFLIQQGYSMPLLVVFEDNQSTISIARKKTSSSSFNTRHIDIKYFFIKDHIGKTLTIKYIPSIDMIADVLTKPLQGELFSRLMNNKLLNIKVV